MDPEIRRLVEETRALARDNNRMLRIMRRSQIISTFLKLIVLAMILLLPLYLYQQYIKPLMGVLYGEAGTLISPGLFGLPSSEQIQTLIDSYKARP